jgi:osmotically-inducible protein OsmY
MDAMPGGPTVTWAVGGGSEATMTDDDLRRDVVAELHWDPRVGSSAIEVSAGAGLVTLRGTVASLRQSCHAGACL